VDVHLPDEQRRRGFEHDGVETGLDELRRGSEPADARPDDGDVRIEAPGHRAR
jgi:hypothetical protein